MNICPSLVEIRSVTSEIRRRKKEEKKKEKTTAVKYKSFGIATPCRLTQTNLVDNTISYGINRFAVNKSNLLSNF